MKLLLFEFLTNFFNHKQLVQSWTAFFIASVVISISIAHIFNKQSHLSVHNFMVFLVQVTIFVLFLFCHSYNVGNFYFTFFASFSFKFLFIAIFSCYLSFKFSDLFFNCIWIVRGFCIFVVKGFRFVHLFREFFSLLRGGVLWIRLANILWLLRVRGCEHCFSSWFVIRSHTAKTFFLKGSFSCLIS